VETLALVIFLSGLTVALVSGPVWLFGRRQKVLPPAPNPGLIQSPEPTGPPGNFSPAMIGALLTSEVERRDFYLVFVDLAVRGYLQLKPMTDNDWQLTRSQKVGRGLTDFETTLLASLGHPGSKITLSDLVSNHGDQLRHGRTELRRAVTRAGWFSHHPINQRRLIPWAAIGGAVLLVRLIALAIALVMGFSVSPWQGLSGAALLIASGILLVSLGKHRHWLTTTGSQTRSQIERYRQWLQDLEPHEITLPKSQTFFDNNITAAFACQLEASFGATFETVISRFTNWGKPLSLTTDWLEVAEVGLTERLDLVNHFLNQASQLSDQGQESPTS